MRSRMTAVRAGLLKPALGLVVAIACGCGSVGEDADADAGVDTTDAAITQADADITQPDADTTQPDADIAQPDAMAPPPDFAETTSAGGHVSGGTFQAEVQFGHWSDRRPFNGGIYSGEGAAAIKP